MYLSIYSNALICISNTYLKVQTCIAIKVRIEEKQINCIFIFLGNGRKIIIIKNVFRLIFNETGK